KKNGEWVSFEKAPQGVRQAVESGTLLDASDIAEATRTPDGLAIIPDVKWEVVRLSEEQVEKVGGVFVLREHTAIRVDSRAFKMSKSRGNVVNPDDIIQEYGADSLRLYEMFMGPLEAVKPWSTRSVEGVY